MSNEHKGIKSAEAAARIRAILREYLGPELPDAVSIYDTGGAESRPVYGAGPITCISN